MFTSFFRDFFLNHILKYNLAIITSLLTVILKYNSSKFYWPIEHLFWLELSGQWKELPCCLLGNLSLYSNSKREIKHECKDLLRKWSWDHSRKLAKEWGGFHFQVDVTSNKIITITFAKEIELFYLFRI